MNEKRKKWILEHHDEQLIKRRKYYYKNIDNGRNSKYKNKYGISISQYNELLEKQNGVCAICLKLEIIKNKKDGILKSLSVDHDHETGKIRGLLCYRCNTCIGSMNDNPYLLQEAVDYLLNQK